MSPRVGKIIFLIPSFPHQSLTTNSRGTLIRFMPYHGDAILVYSHDQAPPFPTWGRWVKGLIGALLPVIYSKSTEF